MTSSLFTPPMVATSAGLAPLRRSGLTLLLNRVGLNALHMNGGHVPKPLLRPGQVGKVKHLMVNLTIDPDAAGPMWWAIVYVPQGTSVGAINVTTSSAATGMYEPNQFVMNCGIADPTAGPIRFEAQSHATSTKATQ